MKQEIHSFTLKSSQYTDIIDITEKANQFIEQAGIRKGLFTASVPGSTASITTIEYEDGVLEDLKNAIERIAPQGMKYDHDAKWGDGNGYSHVRAALLKPSLSLPVEKGHIMHGTWQQIVLMDFDSRARNRNIIFHVIGE
ncbi:MAG: YjbQ family protein [Deltaproteobacteria bacterium]|jgi:secondary thiamine-phosphate synthase enzyme|nr:YjbQ family protein [Deltaproteobacteria bacterium]